MVVQSTERAKKLTTTKITLTEYMYPKWINLLLGAKIRVLLLLKSCKKKRIYFVEIWKTPMTLWGLTPYFPVFATKNFGPHLIHKNSTYRHTKDLKFYNNNNDKKKENPKQNQAQNVSCRYFFFVFRWPLSSIMSTLHALCMWQIHTACTMRTP